MLGSFTKQGNGYLHNKIHSEINSRDLHFVCSPLGKFCLFFLRGVQIHKRYNFPLILDADHELHWGLEIDASSA